MGKLGGKEIVQYDQKNNPTSSHMDSGLICTDPLFPSMKTLCRDLPTFPFFFAEPLPKRLEAQVSLISPAVPTCPSDPTRLSTHQSRPDGVGGIESRDLPVGDYMRRNRDMQPRTGSRAR